MSQTNLPPQKNPAEVMRELRLKMLTTSPGDLGLKPTADFPHVSGIAMDWPIEAGTVTVVAWATGDASVYTTGTFGVFGGIGHQTVRTAATNCVKAAQPHYDEASPTKDYPYPAKGRLRFYFVCFDSVRVIDADLEAARDGKSQYADLYRAAQQVVTELRLIVQQQKGERPRMSFGVRPKPLQNYTKHHYENTGTNRSCSVIRILSAGRIVDFKQGQFQFQG